MKIVYTDFYRNLTDALLEDVQTYLKEGKRVFYIAPSSLSFEKEKLILQKLNKGNETASFRIMVTRFTQLSRYFLLDKEDGEKQISDIGYSMLLYRCLQEFTDNQLDVYNKLTKNQSFIKQLVTLYKELKESGISIADVYQADPTHKNRDLMKILLKFEEALEEGNYQYRSKIQQFTDAILSGKFTGDLQEVVIVVDGYTRFSAEEEQLLLALSDYVSEVVVGLYCSKKAYKLGFYDGSIYQASIDFANHLRTRFKVKSIYKESKYEGNTFTRLTRILESKYDFTLGETEKFSQEELMEIWTVVNQKEEIEHVAKKIRRLMYENSAIHYRDILVLVGDREVYSLQIRQIFDKYGIPYSIGKTEKMQDHPLLAFLDSILRIKKYNYQIEDISNLLKTGLYMSIDRNQIDYFTRYLKYADFSGKAYFSKEFTLNNEETYNLNDLDALRSETVGENSPLQIFLNKRTQKSASLLKAFLNFLEECQLSVNLLNLTQNLSLEEREQSKQVWNCFTEIIVEFAEIFRDKKLSVEEFLELIRSAIFASDYRTVPANVDVVRVQPYDLIQPHQAPYVFAIGLSKNNFPKISRLDSLISEDEREKINLTLESDLNPYQLRVPSQEAGSQSFFTALSLYNAASEFLILSTPDIYGENQSELSDYIAELIEIGIPVVNKISADQSQTLEHIGSYQGLLSNFVRIQREEREKGSELDSNFWQIVGNYLKSYLKNHSSFDLEKISSQLDTDYLSPEVLQILYPSDGEIRASSSSIENFYSCQYKYFLQNQLRLQEVDTARPDSRIHGKFLHRVFERVLNDTSTLLFDEKVEQALQQTRSEYQDSYHRTQEGKFLEGMLTDIVRESASMLNKAPSIQTLELEKSFSKKVELGEALPSLIINGQIDRVDRLDSGFLGVVDYKSSDRKFNLYDFYYQQSLQLLTYLYALKNEKKADRHENFFGAMYLHLQNPSVSLSKGNPIENLTQTLRYQGLFNEEVQSDLGSIFNVSSSYSSDEMNTMINYLEKSYVKAAENIVSGSIKINPFSNKENTVSACQYCQFKSICRFEANLHMNQARIGKKKRISKEVKEQLLDSMEKEVRK